MKVREIMIGNVVSCSPESRADTVAMDMWNYDCGCIPVVNTEQRPVGVVTDRDIAMAAALKHQPLWDIQIQDITNNRDTFCCELADDIHIALEQMRQHGVRRLPVVDLEGKLMGMVSMGDILAAASKDSRQGQLLLPDILDFLKSVTVHHIEGNRLPDKVA